MSARALALALGLVALTPGCKQNPAVAEIQGFEQAACACKDAACGEAQRARIVAWHKDNRATMVSAEEQDAITASMTKAKGCLEALIPPPAKPAGEAPAAEAPSGEVPAAEAPAGEAPTGEAPAAEAPGAEAPAGEAPAPAVRRGEEDEGSADDPPPIPSRGGPGRSP